MYLGNYTMKYGKRTGLATTVAMRQKIASRTSRQTRNHATVILRYDNFRYIRNRGLCLPQKTTGLCQH